MMIYVSVPCWCFFCFPEASLMEKERLYLIYILYMRIRGRKSWKMKKVYPKTQWKTINDVAGHFSLACDVQKPTVILVCLLLQCKMLFSYGLLHVSRTKAKVKKRTSISKIWIIYLKAFPKPHGGVMACPSNSRK